MTIITNLQVGYFEDTSELARRYAGDAKLKGSLLLLKMTTGVYNPSQVTEHTPHSTHTSMAVH